MFLSSVVPSIIILNNELYYGKPVMPISLKTLLAQAWSVGLRLSCLIAADYRCYRWPIGRDQADIGNPPQPAAGRGSSMPRSDLKSAPVESGKNIAE